MLLYVFLVLVVWNGVLGSDDLCDEHQYRVCKMLRGFSFPKTEKDVNRVCPILIINLDCLKDYFEKCGYERGLTEDKLQNIKEIAEDVCREDSPLHLGVVQNIGCFSEVLDNYDESCKTRVEFKTAKIKMHLYDIEAKRRNKNNRDPELWQPLSCIVDALKISFFISKVSERCGSDAKDVASEILTRATISHYACSVSSEEMITELLALLELELEEGSSLRRIMRKE